MYILFDYLIDILYVHDTYNEDIIVFFQINS